MLHKNNQTKQSAKFLQTSRALLTTQFIEIWRTHLLLWCLAFGSLVLGFGYFMQALALTESAQITLVSTAPLIRFVGVLLTILFCTQSICRDLQDKTHLSVLAQPISKIHWFFGKLMGCVLVACCVSLVLGWFLLMNHPENYCVWWLSLTLELMLVSALAGLFALTFGQITPAISSALLIYLASRLTNLFTELALRGDEIHWWEKFAGYLIRIVDLILPKLAHFAQTDWLTDSSLNHHLGQTLSFNLLQVVLYIGLIFIAGWLDLRTREW